MSAPHYSRLIERLNRFPQGAPPSESLYALLRLLFSEREAELVAHLPIKPFTAEKAARIWKMSEAEARKVLDELAGRAILIDMIDPQGQTFYTLPPPMAGFFEFSMMRTRADVDQHKLGELFYQYCNVEEDFIRNLFTDGETQLGRVFIHEPVLSPEVHVLDYERASHVIDSASHIGISRCYCRHKMEIVEQACDAPQDICMTFGNVAASLIRSEFAREVDVAEGRDLLQQAYEHNLVQFGENVREKVAFICNCCGCCCEAMLAAQRFGFMHPVHTSNFMPHIDAETCTGCGKCVDVCPVQAMGLVTANDPRRPRQREARVAEDLCLGCGICARVCPAGSVAMEPRPERVIMPYNSTHRIVMMAIERGDFHHLIFDNRVLWSHRVLGEVLGVVLKLPPLKQALASQQVKSRYMEALIRRMGM